MSPFKINLFMKLFTLVKIPLVAFINPKLVELTDKKCVLKVKLGYRTKNHLNVMYFGALAVGAELSIGVKAVDSIQKSGQKIDFLFKDFAVQFLKRADGDVHFICEEIEEVDQLISAAANSPDRQEKTFNGYAIVPKKSEEPIMKFQLTLSAKNRSRPKE